MFFEIKMKENLSPNKLMKQPLDFILCEYQCDVFRAPSFLLKINFVITFAMSFASVKIIYIFVHMANNCLSLIDNYSNNYENCLDCAQWNQQAVGRACNPPL
ncbi:hypothetical protein Pfo_016359, partial [Paulownia fortunei]